MAESDAVLIARIREGRQEAWNDLIARYEGRLLAFVQSRVGRRAASEDVVQETFIGFLTSLPNYDESRPLEGYLFSIAAFKLTDHLRREGRRPTLPLSTGTSGSSDRDLPGQARVASSIFRSGERRRLEERALAGAIAELIGRWRERSEWEKIQCVEFLFVRSAANKDVAEQMDLSEQKVANIKFDFLAQLRKTLGKQGLSADVFPELYQK